MPWYCVHRSFPSATAGVYWPEAWAGCNAQAATEELCELLELELRGIVEGYSDPCLWGCEDDGRGGQESLLGVECGLVAPADEAGEEPEYEVDRGPAEEGRSFVLVRHRQRDFGRTRHRTPLVPLLLL